MRPVILVIAGVLAPVLLVLDLSSAPEEAGAQLGPGRLPPPPKAGGMALAEALWNRRSARRFDGRPVTREELGYLLWAGSGLNRPGEKKRTAPSAWEAYAITIYVTSPAGTSIYDPAEHALRPAGGAGPGGTGAAGGLAQKDLRSEIPRAEGTRTAPVVLVLVADFSRYPARASPESRRFLAHADCGAIAENIYLAATALGLGTVVTADARPESRGLLGLGEEQMALYVMPVGHPAPEVPAAEPQRKDGQGGKN